MTALHFVMPAWVDDPRRPSGGSIYDRELVAALSGRGRRVRELHLPGAWPNPDHGDLATLASALATVPDGGCVLLDGLIASPAADVLAAERSRLRLAVLVHLPLGVEAGPGAVADRERAALSAAGVLVTTSEWTRRWLVETYGYSVEEIHVARPGVAERDLAPGTEPGGSLLCVGAVTPTKGHDLLISALEQLTDLSWSCQIVGPLDVDPAFAAEVFARSRTVGGASRIAFAGPLTDHRVDAAFAGADLVVQPSRVESFGMVLTEAIARGIPVLATDVGGAGEAVGVTDGREPAGQLVAPDARALAAALRSWLECPDLRATLRAAAARQRGRQQRWSSTALVVDDVIDGFGREPENSLARCS